MCKGNYTHSHTHTPKHLHSYSGRIYFYNKNKYDDEWQVNKNPRMPFYFCHTFCWTVASWDFHVATKEYKGVLFCWHLQRMTWHWKRHCIMLLASKAISTALLTSSRYEALKDTERRALQITSLEKSRHCRRLLWWTNEREETTARKRVPWLID